MTKFKSQSLYIIRIKYWNASRSGSPPSLISAYWNIGISFHKLAKLRKYMQHSVCYRCQSTFQICLFFCRKNKITQIQIVPDIATRCPPQIGFCFLFLFDTCHFFVNNLDDSWHRNFTLKIRFYGTFWQTVIHCTYSQSKFLRVMFSFVKKQGTLCSKNLWWNGPWLKSELCDSFFSTPILPGL